MRKADGAKSGIAYGLRDLFYELKSPDTRNQETVKTCYSYPAAHLINQGRGIPGHFVSTPSHVLVRPAQDEAVEVGGRNLVRLDIQQLKRYTGRRGRLDKAGDIRGPIESQ